MPLCGRGFRRGTLRVSFLAAPGIDIVGGFVVGTYIGGI